MSLSKFLNIELTSTIEKDSDHSVSEDCAALDTTPVVRAGTAATITFHIGRTCIEPEPMLLPRSPCIALASLGCHLVKLMETESIEEDGVEPTGRLSSSNNLC